MLLICHLLRDPSVHFGGSAISNAMRQYYHSIGCAVLMSGYQRETAGWASIAEANTEPF